MIFVDRFEGEYAVCEEDGCIINMDIRLFGDDVSEGDVVVMSTQGIYVTDIEQTNALKEMAKDLSSKLFE